MSGSEHNDLFLESLDTHLHNLSIYSNNVILMLDSNMNLLTINHNEIVQRYMEIIFSNGFAQCVGKATRIKSNSYSLIDHLLCKVNGNFKTGTILTDFNDHLTNFFALQTTDTISTDPAIKTCKDFSKQNIDRFRTMLDASDWTNVTNTEDVNDSFNNFWKTFETFLSLIFL
jgi:hypothetical protein